VTLFSSIPEDPVVDADPDDPLAELQHLVSETAAHMIKQREESIDERSEVKSATEESQEVSGEVSMSSDIPQVKTFITTPTPAEIERCAR